MNDWLNVIKNQVTPTKIKLIFGVLGSIGVLYAWLYQYSLNVGPYFDMQYKIPVYCEVDKFCDLAGTFSIKNESNGYLAFQPYDVDIFLITVKLDKKESVDLSINKLIPMIKDYKNSSTEFLIVNKVSDFRLSTTDQRRREQHNKKTIETNELDDVILPNLTKSRVFRLIEPYEKYKEHENEQKYLFTRIIVKQAKVNIDSGMIYSVFNGAKNLLMSIFFGKNSDVNTCEEFYFYDLSPIINPSNTAKTIINDLCIQLKNDSSQYCLTKTESKNGNE